MVKSVRGAVKIAEDKPEQIMSGVSELIKAIYTKNTIKEKNTISIQFTQTKDIASINPARALRSIGFKDVPLFCSQEPEYEGSVPKIIRVLVTYRCWKWKKAIPVYIQGAEKLRRDLFQGE